MLELSYSMTPLTVQCGEDGINGLLSLLTERTSIVNAQISERGHFNAFAAREFEAQHRAGHRERNHCPFVTNHRS